MRLCESTVAEKMIHIAQMKKSLMLLITSAETHYLSIYIIRATLVKPRLVRLIRELLIDQRKSQKLPDAFIWTAANLLSDTDGLEVEELCDLLTHKKIWIDEALIRNGHVDMALNYMVRFELGSTYARREQIIKHASNRHPNFISGVIEHLIKENLGTIDGYFESFTVNEVAEEPFTLTYSFNYKIIRTFGEYKVAKTTSIIDFILGVFNPLG